MIVLVRICECQAPPGGGGANDPVHRGEQLYSSYLLVKARLKSSLRFRKSGEVICRSSRRTVGVACRRSLNPTVACGSERSLHLDCMLRSPEEVLTGTFQKVICGCHGKVVPPGDEVIRGPSQACQFDSRVSRYCNTKALRTPGVHHTWAWGSDNLSTELGAK
jgi:hypothetical protein